MKQIIKDKTVKACVCGKDKQATVERTAKRRVSSWLALSALIIFVAAAVFDGFNWSDWNDAGGLVVVALTAYIIIGVSVKTIVYKNKKHTLYCSLRHAFYDIV